MMALSLIVACLIVLLAIELHYNDGPPRLFEAAVFITGISFGLFVAIRRRTRPMTRMVLGGAAFLGWLFLAMYIEVFGKCLQLWLSNSMAGFSLDFSGEIIFLIVLLIPALVIGLYVLRAWVWASYESQLNEDVSPDD
jgi:hypothetical protein